MKINNSNFFSLNESLLIGLKKEIEDNYLLFTFFTSNAASSDLRHFIIFADTVEDSTDNSQTSRIRRISDKSIELLVLNLLHEINSLLNFVDQNSSKESFYIRHLGQAKDDFYRDLKLKNLEVKSYKMIAEISRIRRISDKSIELIKAVQELTVL